MRRDMRLCHLIPSTAHGNLESPDVKLLTLGWYQQVKLAFGVSEAPDVVAARQPAGGLAADGSVILAQTGGT